jgi:26S proteasome regulatory subunit N10
LSLQEAEASTAASTSAATTSSDQPPALVPLDAEPTAEPPDITEDEEAAMLHQALQMSTAEADTDMGDHDEDLDEEEAIARAIEMSMRGEDDQQEEKP